MSEALVEVKASSVNIRWFVVVRAGMFGVVEGEKPGKG